MFIFISFTKFGEFWVISSNILSTTSFLCISYDAYRLIHLLVYHRSLRLCLLFLNLFSFCSSDLVISIVPFSFFLIINLFFIGVQFANIQNNTQCSSRQVPPSVPVTHSPPTPRPPPLPPPLVRFPELGVFMFCLPFWYFSFIFLFSPLFLFTVIYIPQMNETI